MIFMILLDYFIIYMGLLDIGLGWIFVFMLNIVFRSFGFIIVFGVFCVIM